MWNTIAIIEYFGNYMFVVEFEIKIHFNYIQSNITEVIAIWISLLYMVSLFNLLLEH